MNAGRKSCSLARPEQCVVRKKVGKMLRRAIWFANDGNHMCALRFLCVLLDSYVHFGILMCNTGFLCTFCHSYVNFGIPMCNLSYSYVFLCDSQVHVTIPTHSTSQEWNAVRILKMFYTINPINYVVYFWDISVFALKLCFFLYLSFF